MSKNRNYETTTTSEPIKSQTVDQTVDVEKNVDTEQVSENKQEVKQEVVVTQAPKAAAVEKINTFESRIEWVKANGSVAEKQVINVLENYVKVCTTSISLEAIAIEQQRLWRLFEYIHSNPTEFRKLFNIVIEFGKQYKNTAFDISMFFRAQGAISLTGNHLQAFNNIRTLIINTINTNDKSKIKSILDIRKIIENDAIPEHVRAQYVAYYE